MRLHISETNCFLFEDFDKISRVFLILHPLCAQVLALAISNLRGSASTCAPEVLPLAPAEVLALPHKAQVLELALAEVLELPHEAEVLALSRAQLGGSRAHTNTYSKAMILYPKGNSMLLNTFLPLFW